jgi:hypothetical protein
MVTCFLFLGLDLLYRKKMNTPLFQRLSSPRARRWLALAALVLLLAAALLLSFALLPGGEPLRLQSTLDPTRLVVPGGLP